MQASSLLPVTDVVLPQHFDWTILLSRSKSSFEMAASAISSFSRGQSALLSLTWQDRDSIRSGAMLTIRKQPSNKHKLSNPSRVLCSVSQSSSFGSSLSDNEVVLKQARLKFCEEVAFRRQDQEISLGKAMLLISAEDEAFLSVNRAKDRLAAHTEGRGLPGSRVEASAANVDGFPLAGKTMSMWLSRFDFLAREVKDILGVKGSCPKPLEVLRAVNTVLFEIQGFKRCVTYLNSSNSYLHHFMTLGSGSDVMLCVLYMEVCQRLGVAVKGAEVGDDVLVWPPVENFQECFETFEGGKSWFTEVLATLHQSHVLDSCSGGLPHESNFSAIHTLKIASKRGILGKALTNLKNLHWKDACKARPGLALTDPLHPLLYANGRLVDHTELAVGALLRPRSLRLALMASERLLLLQPHDWVLRRDHGLLLYHSRRYGEAVQELSICMAFAPTIEAQMLEHFVEKLHLLRVESSWSSLRPPNTPSTLA